MTTEDYIRMAGWELRDLPWKMRRDLVSEIRRQLEELPAETNLLERLGRPHEYAAELRDAAGLERRRGMIAFLRARRPRNLVLTVLALTIIGLAVGAVVWVGSYQPLVPGMGSQDPPGAKPELGSAGEQVEFLEGKPFEVGVSVVNNGRFTVRVLGSEPQSYLPVAARLYLAGPMANTGGFPRPHRRFHPFDLAPGQVALLVLRGTYDATCRVSPGTQSFWTTGDFAVRYRFLWRTATTQIGLPSPLQIDGPKGMSCEGAQAVAGK